MPNIMGAPKQRNRQRERKCYEEVLENGLINLLQGLWVTFRHQRPRYIYTEHYPAERPKVAERYRGAPRLNIDPETNETLCISCKLCTLACSENLIVVTSVRNEQTRRSR